MRVTKTQRQRERPTRGREGGRPPLFWTLGGLSGNGRKIFRSRKKAEKEKFRLIHME